MDTTKKATKERSSVLASMFCLLLVLRGYRDDETIVEEDAEDNGDGPPPERLTTARCRGSVMVGTIIRSNALQTSSSHVRPLHTQTSDTNQLHQHKQDSHGSSQKRGWCWPWGAQVSHHHHHHQHRVCVCVSLLYSCVSDNKLWCVILCIDSRKRPMSSRPCRCLRRWRRWKNSKSS